jgi:hypothetical protein
VAGESEALIEAETEKLLTMNANGLLQVEAQLELEEQA